MVISRMPVPTSTLEGITDNESQSDVMFISFKWQQSKYIETFFSILNSNNIT